MSRLQAGAGRREPTGLGNVDERMKLAITILVSCVGALLALGMVMLYSSSMYEAGSHYLVRQLIWGGLGLAGCIALACVDYQHFKKISWLFFAVTLVLLGLVLLSSPINGARRWLGLGGLGLQPSEFAKIVLILCLAHYGERYQRAMATFWRGLVIPGLLIGVMLALIFIEPDRGTTILLALVSGIILLLAGLRWRYVVLPACVAVAALLISFRNDPMRSARIYSWLHLEETKLGTGHQAYQAMVALGSGGWTGVGLGNGRQKLGFVPEHHTDFIFAMVGEELGLVATVGVLVAVIALVICGIYISSRARDVFGLLLGSGITFLIGLQAFINMGVVSGALPNKGMPLPFISYGGSNLVVLLFGVGLLLSVARFAVETQRVRIKTKHNPFSELPQET